MKTDERKRLENDMYDTANRIVGNVGSKIEATAWDDAWHYYPRPPVSFGFRRDSLDYEEIMDIWTEWIKAYCCFKKYQIPRRGAKVENSDPIIHWLGKPNVRKRDEFPEVEVYFSVSAYLVICRIDDHPIVKQDVTAGVSLDKS